MFGHTCAVRLQEAEKPKTSPFTAVEPEKKQAEISKESKDRLAQQVQYLQNPPQRAMCTMSAPLRSRTIWVVT